MIPILLEGGPYDRRRVEISPGLWNSGVVTLQNPLPVYNETTDSTTERVGTHTDYYRKLYVGSHGSKSYRWVAG